MQTVGSIGEFLEALAPVSLAEDWDNVGLLVGDEHQTVQRLMTCLTITPESAVEAVNERVDLIVTHHPLPFRPLQRLTTASHEGRLLWDLMRAGVSVYSPHTAYDSCQEGINQQLAVGFELQGIKPLIPAGDTPSGTSRPGENSGGGRYGSLKDSLGLEALAERVKSFLGIDHVHLVADRQRPLSHVAVACGSAGEFLRPAIEAGTRRAGHRRGQFPHLPGSESCWHEPDPHGPLRQRTICCRDACRHHFSYVSRTVRLGEPAGREPARLVLVASAVWGMYQSLGRISQRTS